MKFYLAAPVVTDGQTKLKIDHVYEALCDAKGKENVYRPGLHKVPNAWGIPMDMWGQCVFTMDVIAIDQAEWIVLCNFGRTGLTTGTAWECGYAFAKGKKILVIDMPGVKESSLMVTGCAANRVDYLSFISKTFSTNDIFVERGKLPANQTLN